MVPLIAYYISIKLIKFMSIMTKTPLSFITSVQMFRFSSIKWILKVRWYVLNSIYYILPFLTYLIMFFKEGVYLSETFIYHENPIYYIYHGVYNSQLKDTLNNTSCVPRPRFEPGTSSCVTRKVSFCAQLRLPLAALSRGYFFFLRIIHESINYWACEIADIHIVHTIYSFMAE